MDNFFTGPGVISSICLITFELLRHDITHPLFVEVDEIFNLACPASPIHYQRDPVQTTKTSVIGAINMLGLAKRLKIKVLQASTSEIYGDPRCILSPKPIGATSTRSVHALAMTRVSAVPKPSSLIIGGSIVCRSRSSASSIPMVREPTPMMAAWCRALSCKRCSIETSPSSARVEQTRSFCYVDDLSRADQANGTPSDVTGPSNLGNPEEFTMLELAQLILDLTGSRSKIVHRPLPEDDPRQRRPDIREAGAAKAAMVEYLLEAKKFIEHARAAYSAEARNQDLDMAEWCISRAIEEAGHKPPQQACTKPTGQAAGKPN